MVYDGYTIWSDQLSDFVKQVRAQLPAQGCETSNDLCSRAVDDMLVNVGDGRRPCHARGQFTWGICVIVNLCIPS